MFVYPFCNMVLGEQKNYLFTFYIFIIVLCINKINKLNKTWLNICWIWISQFLNLSCHVYLFLFIFINRKQSILFMSIHVTNIFLLWRKLISFQLLELFSPIPRTEVQNANIEWTTTREAWASEAGLYYNNTYIYEFNLY